MFDFYRTFKDTIAHKTIFIRYVVITFQGPDKKPAKYKLFAKIYDPLIPSTTW